MRWQTRALWALWASVLAAQPALAELKYVQQTVSGVPLAVPAGWTVNQTTTPVPTITIEERPGAQDAPSIMIMVVPADPGPAAMAQQLVQAAMPGGATPLGQQAGADGAVLAQFQGAINQIPAKLAIVQRATPQGGVIAAFAAPVARYDALGGPQVLLQVLSGAPPAAAAQAGAALAIPPAYAQSTKPVLDWLVDALDTIPPAQVAAGLRRLNPTEANLLNVYGAFANLVHYRACLADPGVTLPAGATCAQTAAGWRHTLQMTNGDIGQAIQEAQRQRGTLQTSARCGDGRNDSASCAAWQKTMSDMSRMQHESMMRVINNLGGNNCIVGDPGCVPY